jgi:replicative DNA helicase
MKKLCDLEAEQAVLGAIIETPHILPEMPDALKPEAFGDPTHSILFKVIKALEDDPVGINPLTVQGRMAQYPGIGELDVARYLGALGNAYLTMREDGVVRDRGGVFGLAEVVVGLASRRAMLDAIERVGTMAQDLSITIDDLRAVGTDALEAAGTGASIAVQSIDDCLATTLARCDQIVAGQGPRGVKPDLQAWGDLVGPMMGGDMIVLGGATSMGKTALAQQVALEIAAHGTVLVFSLEMSSGQWNDRYLAQITGVPSERIEMGPLTASDVEALKAARETLVSRKLHVCDNPRLTVRGMKALCRRAARKHGKLDLVVIDHLQFIEHYDPRRDGPSKVADITREVKAMAKDLNVPIILVSHLNRDLAKRDGGRPQLSDLFGSSAIEKDADVVCFVHRENYWLSRQGPKPADDPFDEAEAEANRMMWEQALERTKHDAELIIAKRRRGAGSGYRKVRFLPERTLFMDPTSLDTRPAQAYQYERDDRVDIWG